MANFKSTTDDIDLQPLPVHSRFKDLSGRRFGRLQVLGLYGKLYNAPKPVYYWVCLCDCGNKKPVQSACLLRGTTLSCGCLAQENCLKANIIHNESNKTPEYSSYCHAKERCNTPNHLAFAGYGGRGIKFLFNSYKEFLAEVGRKPTAKHSLDRIDNNGNYEKGNIRWATPHTQRLNTRTNRLITIDGVTLTATEWAEKYNIGREAIYSRLKRQRCDKCAVTVLINKGHCVHKNANPPS